MKACSRCWISRIPAPGARLAARVFLGGIAVSACLSGFADPVCTTDSFTNSSGTWVLINAAPCATYGEVISRWQTNNNVATMVKMKYMINDPAGAAKAIVVLFTGKSGNAAIVPGTNGSVTSAATNFLVRSAELFANAGYRAVSVDSPEDVAGNKLYTNGFSSAEAAYDNYRVSVTNAWDIQSVIENIPGYTNLHVFLAGTSRGTITAVAQYHLGMGICLSSVVNSGNPAPGNPLYIAVPSQPSLQPSNVTVPVQLLVNADDICPVASPSITTNSLWTNFTGDTVLGGALNQPPSVEVSDNFDGSDACGATAPHGYLGIETASVGTITSWLDQVLADLALKNAIARDTQLTLTNSTPVRIDLSKLIAPPPSGTPAISLPYSTSVQAVVLSLTNTTVTYVPNGSGMDDGFLYQFTDTNRVRSIGMVRIRFGTNPQLSIQPAVPDEVTLSWPVQSAGWFLQESPDLLSAAWSFSGSGPTNPSSVPVMNGTNRFYRLFKP